MPMCCLSSRAKYPAKSVQSRLICQMLECGRLFARDGLVHGCHRIALARDFGGDALKNLRGHVGSTSSVSSDWPSMSMNPGATMRPAASMRCLAGRSSRRPMAAMRPARMPDIGRVPGRTRPVDHLAMLDDHIEGWRPRSAARGSLRRPSRRRLPTRGRPTREGRRRHDRGRRQHRPRAYERIASRGAHDPIGMVTVPPSKGAIINSNAARDGESTPWVALRSAAAARRRRRRRTGLRKILAPRATSAVYLMTYACF